DAHIDGARGEGLHQLGLAGESDDLGIDVVFREDMLIDANFEDGEGPADLHGLADTQVIGGLYRGARDDETEQQERGARDTHRYFAGAGSLSLTWRSTASSKVAAAGIEKRPGRTR